MNGLTKPTTIIIVIAVAIFVVMLLIFGNHEPLVPEMTFEEQIKGALK